MMVFRFTFALESLGFPKKPVRYIHEGSIPFTCSNFCNCHIYK